MKDSDKVTVLCIALNHEKWIEEALESVKQQDYYPKELFVIDNGSTDSTPDRIKHWISQQPDFFKVQFFRFSEIQPYCKLFNEFLRKATGNYLVDLSGDDLLYPEHLVYSIEELQKVPSAAFVFSDAYLLDEKSQIKTFYKRTTSGELKEELELSTLYDLLIRRNVICSPTMVFRTDYLRKEGGYDESLYYEDFDIQLRLTRKYPVVFSDHFGVLKRIHNQSMSFRQYQRRQSKMLPSTVRVCWKILQMNQNSEENMSLSIRVQFELKHALWSANFEPAQDLVRLGERLGLKGIKFLLYKIWAKRRWDISWLYIQLT